MFLTKYPYYPTKVLKNSNNKPFIGKLLRFECKSFESMRNMFFRNSSTFSYPLQVLVRLSSNMLIITEKLYLPQLI